MTLSEWRRVMDVNLTSTFMLSKAAYPELKKAGGGKIINIGSMASYMGGARWAAYGPAKNPDIRHASQSLESTVICASRKNKRLCAGANCR